MGKGVYDTQSIYDQQTFDAWYDKQELKGDELIAAMRAKREAETFHEATEHEIHAAVGAGATRVEFEAIYGVPVSSDVDQFEHALELDCSEEAMITLNMADMEEELHL